MNTCVNTRNNLTGQAERSYKYILYDYQIKAYLEGLSSQEAEVSRAKALESPPENGPSGARRRAGLASAGYLPQSLLSSPDFDPVLLFFSTDRAGDRGGGASEGEGARCQGSGAPRACSKLHNSTLIKNHNKNNNEETPLPDIDYIIEHYPGSQLLKFRTRRTGPKVQVPKWGDWFMEYGYYSGLRIDFKQVGRSYGLQQDERGKRGAITSFSKRSRVTMIETLGRIIWSESSKPLFITLTYPMEKVPSIRDSYDDLKKFVQMCKRKWPGFCGIWKKELQPNTGNPHFHLLIWGVGFRSALTWVKRFWYKAVGSGLEKHLRAGTNVNPVTSPGNLMGYFSKYMTKLESVETGEKTGRWWGKINAKLIPLATGQEIHVTEEAFNSALRIHRKMNEKRLYKSMQEAVLRTRGRDKKRLVRKKYRRIARTTRRFLIRGKADIEPICEKIADNLVPF